MRDNAGQEIFYTQENPPTLSGGGGGGGGNCGCGNCACGEKDKGLNIEKKSVTEMDGVS
jgi:hypothetical protein